MIDCGLELSWVLIFQNKGLSDGDGRLGRRRPTALF
jgi:hypothetical protein